MTAILVLNMGSSTLKSALFQDPSANAVPIWEAHLEKKKDFKTEAMNVLKKAIEEGYKIRAVGHRVVHGGEAFFKPVVLTKKVIKSLSQLNSLAPLHNPVNLQGIAWAQKLLPDVPHVAVFDTAFHHTIPPVNYTYPVPLKWLKQGIRRYGFHGINHQGCFEELMTVDLSANQKKVVCCHLGNGCSLAAISNGSCIDTSMGFTPMEGLMMGSRSGSIDPGIIFQMLREKKYTAGELENVLNRESGLFAITGTNDMRSILSRKDSMAQLGCSLFCHRLVKEIGSMICVLGGLDTLIFTGGIGENADVIRRLTCKQLSFLGIQLIPKKIVEGKISAPKSKVDVFVFKAREEWQIAKLTDHLLNER